MINLRDYLAEGYMSASFVGAGVLANVVQKYPPLSRTFVLRRGYATGNRNSESEG